MREIWGEIVGVKARLGIPRSRPRQSNHSRFPFRLIGADFKKTFEASQLRMSCLGIRGDFRFHPGDLPFTACPGGAFQDRHNLLELPDAEVCHPYPSGLGMECRTPVALSLPPV